MICGQTLDGRRVGEGGKQREKRGREDRGGELDGHPAPEVLHATRSFRPDRASVQDNKLR